MAIPIGLELAKRDLITDVEIKKALDYQKDNPNEKLLDIVEKLNLIDRKKLIDFATDYFGCEAIDIKVEDIKISISKYLSLDMAKKYMCIPFEEKNGKLKVVFADPRDKVVKEKMALLALAKGLVIEPYYTFKSNVVNILNQVESSQRSEISDNYDITTLIDTIIKTGMDKRASDIHIEPMENFVRVRYRIDGELITVAKMPSKKKEHIIGRIKAISNMFQEKKTSQDGRIILYPDYNIRVSSQKNVYGEKIVLRLLKKDKGIQNIFDLGFPKDENILKNSFDKRNSITVIAAPTGEGKTTTLYSILDYLNKPSINVTTIEDPVEIRIEGLNQIEIDENTSFADSLRTVLRQDPDIILVGEIRDLETAEIAIQSGQTGHYVLSTIHTIDAVEVITRLRKMGISDYDIASTLATSVSQRLVRRVCNHCKEERNFTDDEIEKITKIGERYGVKFNLKGKKTYNVKGCSKCNYSGYLGRIAAFEVLNIDDEIKEGIMKGLSTIDIRDMAMKKDYKPLIIDAMNKIVDGTTTLEEVNHKLALF